jgi:hypothetical protein
VRLETILVGDWSRRWAATWQDLEFSNIQKAPSPMAKRLKNLLFAQQAKNG